MARNNILGAAHMWIWVLLWAVVWVNGVAGEGVGWSATAQVPGTWDNHPAWIGTHRVLLRSQFIFNNGTDIALVFRGYEINDDTLFAPVPYTVSHVSIMQAADPTDFNSGVEASWTPVTFNGNAPGSFNWESGSITLLPGSYVSMTSDWIDFDFEPTQSYFVTFFCSGAGPVGITTATTGDSSISSVWIQNATRDVSSFINWNNIPGYPKPNIVSMNIVNAILQVLVGPPDPNFDPSGGVNVDIWPPPRVFTKPTFTFNDGSPPNVFYDNNLDLSWIITPGTPYVKLTFNRFALDGRNDVVEIYDGDNMRNTSKIAKLIQNVIPPVFLSSGPSLYIHFTTDPTIGATGWEVTYEGVYATNTQCQSGQPNMAITTLMPANSSTNIASHTGGGTYACFLNCYWWFQARGDNRPLVATLNSFATEYMDALQVWDANWNLYGVRHKLGSFIGYTRPTRLVSYTGVIGAIFRTNAAGTNIGFNMTVALMACEEFCDARGGTCQNGRCVCNPGYVGGDCSSTTCTGTLLVPPSPGGVLRDKASGATSLYANAAWCDFVVDAPPGTTSLTVWMERLDTEPNIAADSIFFYKGNDHYSYVGPFSGSALMPALYYTTSQPGNAVSVAEGFYLSFRTNMIDQRTGFSLRYAFNQVIGACPGTPACSGQGTCVSGVCQCFPLFNGTDCSQRLDNHQWFSYPVGQANPGVLQGHGMAAWENTVFIYGGQDINEIYQNDMYSFDAVSGVWAHVTPQFQSALPAPMCYFAMGVLRDHDSANTRPQIIVQGGETYTFQTGVMQLQDTWLFDMTADSPTWSKVDTDAWNQANGGILGREKQSYCVNNDPTTGQDTFVVLMGLNLVTSGYLDSMLRFTLADDTTGQWERVVYASSLSPLMRSSSPAACMNNQLYLFGGLSVTGDTSYDIWMFDFGTRIWAQVAPTGDFPNRQWNHQAIARYNRQILLVAGVMQGASAGETDSGTWLFDAEQRSLTNLPFLRERPMTYNFRSPTAATAINGTVFMYGGGGHPTNTPLGDFWMYIDQPASAQWSTVVLPPGASVITGTAGDDLQFVVRAKDQFGNLKYTGADDVTAMLMEGDSQTATGKTTDNLDGTYTVSFSYFVAGLFNASVSLNGEPLGGSPYAVVVGAAPIRPGRSLISVDAPDGERVGVPMAVVVVCQDQYGNINSSASLRLNVSLTTGDTAAARIVAFLPQSIVYNTENITINFVPQQPGDFDLNVYSPDGVTVQKSQPLNIARASAVLTLDAGVFWAFSTAALVCFLFILFIASVIYVKREWPIVKAASPLFCMLTLIGAMLGVAFVPIYGLDYDRASVATLNNLCRLYPWWIGMVFVLVFVPVFAKVRRIHGIFNNPTLKVNMAGIRNKDLLLMVFFAMIVELSLNVGWITVNPQQLVLAASGDDYQYLCQGENSRLWIGLLIVYKIIILLWGVYLAFRTRHAPAVFNDAKSIGFVIYTIALSTALVIPAVTDSASMTASFALVAITVLFAMITTVTMLFGVKVFKVLFRPNDPEMLRTNTAKQQALRQPLRPKTGEMEMDHSGQGGRRLLGDGEQGDEMSPPESPNQSPPTSPPLSPRGGPKGPHDPPSHSSQIPYDYNNESDTQHESSHTFQLLI